MARRARRSLTRAEQVRSPAAELLAHDPALAEIVRRLVAAYRPERVYLFGSVARGEADAGRTGPCAPDIDRWV